MTIRPPVMIIFALVSRVLNQEGSLRSKWTEHLPETGSAVSFLLVFDMNGKGCSDPVTCACSDCGESGIALRIETKTREMGHWGYSEREKEREGSNGVTILAITNFPLRLDPSLRTRGLAQL